MISIMIKSAIVLAVAACIASALRRQSAASRVFSRRSRLRKMPTAPSR